MLYFQCDSHEYIVGSGGSPIFIPIANRVDCYVCTKPNYIYTPFSSVQTVPLTYPNRLMLHIYHILLSLILGVIESVTGSLICKILFVWVVDKTWYFVCIHIICILGWMEDHAPHCPKNVPPRQTYIYIVQRRWWQRHCNRIVMIRCT